MKEGDAVLIVLWRLSDGINICMKERLEFISVEMSLISILLVTVLGV